MAGGRRYVTSAIAQINEATHRGPNVQLGWAFWASNRFGGVLYVLKGDAFISISLGGTDKEEAKLEKSKALAQKALPRL
jgi:hypothetical protein